MQRGGDFSFTDFCTTLAHKEIDALVWAPLLAHAQRATHHLAESAALAAQHAQLSLEDDDSGVQFLFLVVSTRVSV